jgi:hypothetical protein
MRVTLGLLLVLLPLSHAQADLPWPRLDRLSALGVNQGSEVDVELNGADLEGLNGLMFDHPGLSATAIEGKERWYKVKAAPDTPPGTYDVRTVGRFGVSSPRLFAVSRGLKDAADNDKNRSLAEAQLIELNTAINGKIDGNAEDFYKLLGVKGQRVWIDCQAQRLDSELDGQLSLIDSQGRTLATNGDHYGVDPFIDVTLPTDGEYFIVLSDLSYRGGYPYRLVVSNLPHVEMVYPAAVQAGTTANLTAYGANLGAGSKPSTWTVQDQTLDELPFSMAITSDELNLGAYRFRSHPTHHSVLPTAATATLLGTQVFSDPIDNTFNTQPVLVTDQAVTLEVEPNNERDKPQGLTLPAVVAGRFNAPQDADWYEFKTAPEEDGNYFIDAYCERIAGRADPYVAVYDDQGNRVNELDDYGHRMEAFDGHLRDPSSNPVRLSKDKVYRVLVQDRYRRGGGRYQYVLEIRRPTPDLFAASIHSDNQRPHSLNIWKGTAECLDIVVHQWEGYNGPLTVTAEGLPPGMHSAPLHISNNIRGSLVFWTDENAPDWNGAMKLMIEGERDGQKFRREVRPYTRVSNSLSSSRPMREVAGSIRELGPFIVTVEPAELSIEAGKEAQVKVLVRRLWPDFKDKVSLQHLSWPGQIQLNNFDINGDQTEATVTIKVQAGTQPGKHTLALLAQGQVPFHKDPASKERPNTLVALPSRPITLTVTAPPKAP